MRLCRRNRRSCQWVLSHLDDLSRGREAPEDGFRPHVLRRKRQCDGDDKGRCQSHGVLPNVRHERWTKAREAGFGLSGRRRGWISWVHAAGILEIQVLCRRQADTC